MTSHLRSQNWPAHTDDGPASKRLRPHPSSSETTKPQDMNVKQVHGPSVYIVTTRVSTPDKIRTYFNIKRCSVNDLKNCHICPVQQNDAGDMFIGCPPEDSNVPGPFAVLAIKKGDQHTMLSQPSDINLFFEGAEATKATKAHYVFGCLFEEGHVPANAHECQDTLFTHNVDGWKKEMIRRAINALNTPPPPVANSLTPSSASIPPAMWYEYINVARALVSFAKTLDPQHIASTVIPSLIQNASIETKRSIASAFKQFAESNPQLCDTLDFCRQIPHIEMTQIRHNSIEETQLRRFIAAFIVKMWYFMGAPLCAGVTMIVILYSIKNKLPKPLKRKVPILLVIVALSVCMLAVALNGNKVVSMDSVVQYCSHLTGYSKVGFSLMLALVRDSASLPRLPDWSSLLSLVLNTSYAMGISDSILRIVQSFMAFVARKQLISPAESEDTVASAEHNVQKTLTNLIDTAQAYKH